MLIIRGSLEGPLREKQHSKMRPEDQESSGEAKNSVKNQYSDRTQQFSSGIADPILLWARRFRLASRVKLAPVRRE